MIALTYNVHGLPAAITGDDTPGRMAAIAPSSMPSIWWACKRTSMSRIMTC